MPTTVDLAPTARRMAELVRAVPDSGLDDPTPCAGYTLGELLDHVHAFCLAFTAAATKDTAGIGDERPEPDASRLEDDWRSRIPGALDRLAEAWSDPDAWTGMTRAGGVDMPGEVAGLVALDELVVHGWDMARASGQLYDCDEASLTAVHDFVSQFSGPDQAATREGMFGPVVAVPEDAPLLDRVIGLTGRDPAWAPTGQPGHSRR